mmetsp:Transcript_82941/g.234629  ORF Transcript_82941/g.234629 Transcript_82941/m.234629 type:complete len:214 (-) Transcript_82941:667-1308(-)
MLRLVGYSRTKFLQRLFSCMDRASTLSWSQVRSLRTTGFSPSGPEPSGSASWPASWPAWAWARGAASALRGRGRLGWSCTPVAGARMRAQRAMALSFWHTPTRLKTSLRREDLICQSSGDSACMLGLRFTSRSQGFKSSSTMASKPYTSKQFERLCIRCRVLAQMNGSTDSRVFTAMSMMRDHIRSTSTPVHLRCLLSAERDHLWPTLSACRS